MLAGVGEVGFCLDDLSAGLAQGGPLDRLQEGLPDGDGPGAAVVVLAGIDRTPEDGGVCFEFVEIAADADADLGEQLGAGQGHGFLSGFGAGAGGPQDGGVGEGSAPGAVQVEPARGLCVGGGSGQGEQAAGEQQADCAA